MYGSIHILRNQREWRVGSLKCLRMIMREWEGSWPYNDISKNNFFTK